MSMFEDEEKVMSFRVPNTLMEQIGQALVDGRPAAQIVLGCPPDGIDQREWRKLVAMMIQDFILHSIETNAAIWDRSNPPRALAEEFLKR